MHRTRRLAADLAQQSRVRQFASPHLCGRDRSSETTLDPPPRAMASLRPTSGELSLRLFAFVVCIIILSPVMAVGLIGYMFKLLAVSRPRGSPARRMSRSPRER